MKTLMSSLLLGAGLLGCAQAQCPPSPALPPLEIDGEPSAARIQESFSAQGIRINGAEAQGVRANVLLAIREARSHGLGNGKVDFAAAEIASDLGLSPAHTKQIVASIGALSGRSQIHPRPHPQPWPRPCPPPPPPLDWNTYFHETTNLCNQPGFMALMSRNQFHPVKISWEDIGRNANSAWGDRISDVGIWVRQREEDPASARLALSVRRDGNFRDKVLMVPAERIKLHVQERGRTVEKTLPQRLQELGLASGNRDRNVIVSNQFAIVPVPSRSMQAGGSPPRAAFTFSIYPYGSTNYVITDVIEGSHEAIVGPGSHQMLFANVQGRKAPFTASRAQDRPDLLNLEKTLKARGMDVDVQRYYLIQIPLRRDARGIQISGMGTSPARSWKKGLAADEASGAYGQGAPMSSAYAGAPSGPAVIPESEAPKCAKRAAPAGLDRVAIGHGETEGAYFAGSGYQGARAEEPIRVTVVYFVTPVGKVTARDMETFSQAFANWDAQAIWGGSFVTKETN